MIQETGSPVPSAEPTRTTLAHVVGALQELGLSDEQVVESLRDLVRSGCVRLAGADARSVSALLLGSERSG